jgi:hypothetical protein
VVVVGGGVVCDGVGVGGGGREMRPVGGFGGLCTVK